MIWQVCSCYFIHIVRFIMIKIIVRWSECKLFNHTCLNVKLIKISIQCTFNKYVYSIFKTILWPNSYIYILYIQNSQGFSTPMVGQLGHGDRAAYKAPKHVQAFDEIPIKQVACGEDFTICVTGMCVWNIKYINVEAKTLLIWINSTQKLHYSLSQNIYR